MLDDAVTVNGQVLPDLLCFSHLRWDFVYQRPQHLLSRAARTMRVIFWEEPLYGDRTELVTRVSNEGVYVATPHLAWGVDADTIQRTMLDDLRRDLGIVRPVLWYYTPVALGFSSHLRGSPTVFDCMDDLASFAGADPTLPARDAALMARADLVFTGGLSLYETRRTQHRAVHAFPSGVDVAHFMPARGTLPEPADQAGIPGPRVGFFGVLDERLDQALLDDAARLRPDLHFVLIGPVVKIDSDKLPRRPNIHYLPPKDYEELPAYIAHWDVAMMPFALNAATRYISPTKTPEYLASGRPVVSTEIRDVERSWGATPFVAIAGDAAGFVAAIDRMRALPPGWWDQADAMLATMSWDAIWARMATLIRDVPPRRRAAPLRARYDTLVVGAGFAGAVLAERLAEGSGQRVHVVDRRPHIGGNAFDRHDAAGVLIHPYGPHIFHTNSTAVLDYLSRFTAWRAYEHRVLADIDGELLPIPINRETVNRFFGVALTEDEVGPFLRAKAEPVAVVRNSEDVVVAAVGRELYEAFFRGYTRKQWGLDPSALDKSVASRVPARCGDDDRYFTDRYQCMPLNGYTAMFDAMLDHPKIDVSTATEYVDIDPASYDQLIFTGPIDEFFGFRFGKLPYRSLRFRHETLDRQRAQPVAVINHPGPTVDYTRVTEFKHLTGQVHAKTSLCYEYPMTDGDPYYPIPRAETAALYARYRSLADATPGVTFVGRLATYRYLNMDQVVGQALATYARLSKCSPVETAAAN